MSSVIYYTKITYSVYFVRRHASVFPKSATQSPLREITAGKYCQHCLYTWRDRSSTFFWHLTLPVLASTEHRQAIRTFRVKSDLYFQRRTPLIPGEHGVNKSSCIIFGSSGEGPLTWQNKQNNRVAQESTLHKFYVTITLAIRQLWLKRC